MRGGDGAAEGLGVVGRGVGHGVAEELGESAAVARDHTAAAPERLERRPAVDREPAREDVDARRGVRRAQLLGRELRKMERPAAAAERAAGLQVVGPAREAAGREHDVDGVVGERLEQRQLVLARRRLADAEDEVAGAVLRDERVDVAGGRRRDADRHDRDACAREVAAETRRLLPARGEDARRPLDDPPGAGRPLRVVGGEGRPRGGRVAGGEPEPRTAALEAGLGGGAEAGQSAQNGVTTHGTPAASAAPATAPATRQAPRMKQWTSAAPGGTRASSRTWTATPARSAAAASAAASCAS